MYIKIYKTRKMELQTRVQLPRDAKKIQHKDTLFLMGSCFVEQIGKRLKENKFNLVLNPTGILYNPHSISQAINDLLSKRKFTESDLFQENGLFHSYAHHSRFSGDNSNISLKHINTSQEKAIENISKTNFFIITLGTAYAYYLKTNNRVVANCHKQPEALFERKLLTIESIVNLLEKSIIQWKKENPKTIFIFTVSPIRHKRDGLHQNQLSKASLLLAINELQKKMPQNIVYFPSYEILIDELRDYRFYADDMIHPSQLAIDYIWECFTKSYFSSETLEINSNCQKINKALLHRPLHPKSHKYQIFLSQIVLKINDISNKYPYLDFKNELEICHTLLNK